MIRVHHLRQILRFLAVANVLVSLWPSGTSWSRTAQSKGKVLAKKSTDLEEELAKHLAPLTGSAIPRIRSDDDDDVLLDPAKKKASLGRLACDSLKRDKMPIGYFCAACGFRSSVA